MKLIYISVHCSENRFIKKQDSIAMLSVVELNKNDKVLDLGCDYAIVGVFSSKIVDSKNVVMTDIDNKEVEVSRENILLNDVQGIRLYQSDGFKDINEKNFAIILSNPPYHADFSVPKEFIEKGFNRLVICGKMYFYSIQMLMWS